MTIHRYPIDLGSDSKKYPYMQFTAIKYKDRSFVINTQERSSNVDYSQPEETIREDSFYLPLPQQVDGAYNLNWEMSDLRVLQAGADALLGNAGFGDSIKNLAGVVFDKTAGVFTRQTPNPKKQALFKGIEPRTFSFSYTFSPQSLKEAELVERIIREMTKYSLPSLETERDAFFQFPHEFEISFHNVAGFPKISNCVCTNVNHSWAPNAMSLLKSGHAVQTTMTLTFLETELLRKQKPGI